MHHKSEPRRVGCLLLPVRFFVHNNRYDVSASVEEAGREPRLSDVAGAITAAAGVFAAGLGSGPVLRARYSSQLAA